MRLTRAQILKIYEALEEDFSIDEVDIVEDSSGKLRISAVINQPTLRPIRMTKVYDQAKSSKPKLVT